MGKQKTRFVPNQLLNVDYKIREIKGVPHSKCLGDSKWF